jgi:hypothetical protein
MTKNVLTRRDATNRIMKTVAAAAGLSVLDLKRVLAAQAGQRNSPSSDALADQLKALRTLIAGRREVFVSEYGRMTPIDPKVIRPGQNLPCPAHFFGAGDPLASGSCAWLNCDGTNTCAGQCLGDGGGAPDCPKGGECTGTNSCDGQTCSTQKECHPNNCPGNDCGLLGNCKPANNQILSDLLAPLSGERYVQDLMRQYRITGTTALAGKLDALLTERREGMLEFRAGDLRKAADLALRLKQPQGRLFADVRDMLPQATRTLVSAYAGSGSPSPQLVNGLVDGLNHLMRGPNLYNAGRFADVRLSSSLRRTASRRLSGTHLMRLNRMLLEQAFSGEIRQTLPAGVR